MAKASSDEYLDRLRSVPLFAECDDAELKQIAGLGTEINVSSGQALTTEGGAAHEAFLLMDGHATATRGGKQIATFGPGDFFGEMALLLNVPRTATVAATSEVTLVVMHDRNFRAMEEEIPAIAKRVNAIMQERRAKSAEQGIET
jgi:CRP/FNR family cyclic AMP-dependent transcriptional regulator